MTNQLKNIVHVDGVTYRVVGLRENEDVPAYSRWDIETMNRCINASFDTLRAKELIIQYSDDAPVDQFLWTTVIVSGRKVLAVLGAYEGDVMLPDVVPADASDAMIEAWCQHVDRGTETLKNAFASQGGSL
jgi:hypothetical protein